MIGRASSIFSVSRQVAASLGVAILATVLTSRLDYHDAVLADPNVRDAALTAFHDSFLFAGALSVLGVIACLFVDDRKAAAATIHGAPAEASSEVVMAPEAAG